MLLLFSCMSHLPTSGGGGRVLYSLQQQQYPHHPPTRLIFLSTGDDVPLGANVLAWNSSLFCSIACYNNRVVFKSFVELQEGEKNKLANMYRHSGTHLVGRVCMCSSFLCFLGESGCEGLIAETWKTLCLTCFIRHKLMMRQIPLLVLLPSWRCSSS